MAASSPFLELGVLIDSEAVLKPAFKASRVLRPARQGKGFLTYSRYAAANASTYVWGR